MKFALYTFVLAAAASAAFAQTTVSPTQVCQKVARINSSNGSVCAGLIAKNIYDSSALSLAFRAADQGTAVAIEVLRASANRRLDAAAGSVCEAIVPVNNNNVVPCLNAVLDTVPAPELVRIAVKLVPHGSAHAVMALKAGASAYLFPPAADVCEAMTSVNQANTVVCIQVIANKITLNGSEQVCKANLSNGSAYAVECLRNIVTDYVPMPQPSATIMVETQKLQDLKRELKKVRAQLDRGMVDRARENLQEAVRAVNQILKESDEF